MTEPEWLECPSPAQMLEFLRHEAYCRRRPQPSRRKLRLFACACCRRAWPSLGDDGRRAVEVAERYADRRATRAELALALAAVKAGARTGNAGLAAARAASLRGSPDEAAPQAALAGDVRRWGAECAAQAGLVRDVFGNPFRPAPALPPAWASWGGGAIPELARTIYESRAFERLPALADDLEEAGCANAAVLNHCRQAAAEHVRGCWVLDLLLGKE
jgi:hypothetical protein